MTVADYKRLTMGDSIRKEAMSTAPNTENKPEIPNDPAEVKEVASTQQQQAKSSEKQDAVSFPQVFEMAVNSLNEDQRKIAIQGQQTVYKELENLQAELTALKEGASKETNEKIKALEGELQKARSENGSMKEMYMDNIKTLMQSIKDFYQQDGENPNVTSACPDYDNIEASLREHPEMARNMMPIISCALNRNRDLMTKLKVHQQESERSQEERELFARMRGFQRDSAKPTYGMSLRFLCQPNAD